jgi:hypothetical protein
MARHDELAKGSTLQLNNTNSAELSAGLVGTVWKGGAADGTAFIIFLTGRMQPSISGQKEAPHFNQPKSFSVTGAMAR